MIQTPRLNALDRFFFFFFFIKARSVGAREGEDMLNEGRAQHQSGPTPKGGKMSKGGTSQLTYGFHAGNMQTSPRLWILEFQCLDFSLFQSPRSAQQ